ncbi:MAG: potassium channel family protein [Flavobacteriales bacterium]
MNFNILVNKFFGTNELYFASRWFFAVIATGTAGFLLIENFSLVDAFYMTVITVSTVGFSEVETLSVAGRIFTSILILSSIGSYAYFITVFSRTASESKFYKKMKEKRNSRTISKLTGHVVICGYGRNGRQAAETLNNHNKPYIVIDSNETAVNNITVDHRHFTINGDVTHDEVLELANVQAASALISTLPKDADNLFVVLTARQMNPNLKIISRASNDNTVNKLYVAGADNVIMPDKVGGSHMATLVVSPDLVEFIDAMTVGSSSGITLEEICYHHIPEHLQGKTILELKLRESSGCSIIGLKTADGNYIINPSVETKITPEEKLFVLGNPEQIKALNTLFNIN